MPLGRGFVLAVDGRRVSLLALFARRDRLHLFVRAPDRLESGRDAEAKADRSEPGRRSEARVEPAPAEEADHDTERELEADRPEARIAFPRFDHANVCRGGTSATQ